MLVGRRHPETDPQERETKISTLMPCPDPGGRAASPHPARCRNAQRGGSTETFLRLTEPALRKSTGASLGKRSDVRGRALRIALTTGRVRQRNPPPGPSSSDSTFDTPPAYRCWPMR